MAAGPPGIGRGPDVVPLFPYRMLGAANEQQLMRSESFAAPGYQCLPPLSCPEAAGGADGADLAPPPPEYEGAGAGLGREGAA